MIAPFSIDNLQIQVHPTRPAMGAAAAESAAGEIRRLLSETGEANVVFSSAVSQSEFLAALGADSTIDWTRVTAFHVDEYAGMSEDHPASFRRFLKDHLFHRVPVRRFHTLEGQAPDLSAECERYAALLRSHPPSLAILGIGENGHIAFNDPPVCRFDDPFDVKLVQLDHACRMQQVHDGAFARLEDVPMVALTVTVSRLMRIPRAVVVVPGPAKREAVRRTLEGPVETACPASILRRHRDATLYLDSESASLLAANTES